MQVTNLYILSGPDGRVRYVGKTVQPLSHRLSSHLSQARKGIRDRRCNWLRSIGLMATIDLVESVHGDGAAEEIALIAGLRAFGAPLVNLTGGGEGALGRVVSAESREKIRTALKGRPGRVKSPAELARLSAALKGRKPAAHVMAAARAANLGSVRGPLSTERKAKISARKMRLTPELIETGKQLHMLGWSQQRVADALGVSQSQFSTRLKGRNR